MEGRFRDRQDAGQQLARMLAKFDHAGDTIVIALPRGGVVVAFEIAAALHLPLDVCIVRKLGVPWQPELAMGAIAMGGVEVIHWDLITALGIRQQEIDQEVALERIELNRREKGYRGDRPWPGLIGKTAIVVDDGIATGATAVAAIRALRLQGVKRVVIAAGVAAPSSLGRLSPEADEVVSVIEPARLSSIGEWFEDFTQVTDAEVQTLLTQSWAKHPASSAKTSVASSGQGVA